jgi:hypothetical protein
MCRYVNIDSEHMFRVHMCFLPFRRPHHFFRSIFLAQTSKTRDSEKINYAREIQLKYLAFNYKFLSLALLHESIFDERVAPTPRIIAGIYR